jgi:hypothetical protein
MWKAFQGGKGKNPWPFTWPRMMKEPERVRVSFVITRLMAKSGLFYTELTKDIEALGLPVIYQEGGFLQSTTPGGNPGTEDSGIFDMFLLARTTQLILPYSSSFGLMSSGLGKVPVLSVWHEYKENFKNDRVWFTTSLYREPCFFHGAKYLQELSPARREQFKALTPIWMEQSQCHYYV